MRNERERVVKRVAHGSMWSKESSMMGVCERWRWRWGEWGLNIKKYQVVLNESMSTALDL